MMARNSNWWSMHHQLSLLPTQHVFNGSSSLSFDSFAANNQEPTSSGTRLLLGGDIREGNEERSSLRHFQPKKFEILEGKELYPFPSYPVYDNQILQNINLYGPINEESQGSRLGWSKMVASTFSGSFTTSLSSNHGKLPFRNEGADDSLEKFNKCNRTAIGGACKKTRAQPSLTQPALKVRKEKQGDRIIRLHQLVSPFGKTDTASVLLEASRYIRFLETQIELLNSICLKRKRASTNQININTHENSKDLRSRGLCLVPVSCIQGLRSNVDH